MLDYPHADDMARLAVVTYVGLAGEQLAQPRVLTHGRHVDREALEAGHPLHHYGRVRMEEDTETVGRLKPAAALVSIAMLPRVRKLLASDPRRPVVVVSRLGEKMQPVMDIRRPR